MGLKESLKQEMNTTYSEEYTEKKGGYTGEFSQRQVQI